MIIWLTVFFLTIGVDYAWTKYTTAAAERRAIPASIWSMFIFLLGGFNTVAYVADRWLLIPAVLGAFVGTYSAIKWGHGK